MSSPPDKKQQPSFFWMLVLLSALTWQTFHLPQTLATSTIYFTSVNDKVLPLADNTMPVWINGQIYVPYTTFDQHSTGTDHGITASQNASGTFVTLEGKKGILTFDVKNGQCYDEVSKFSYPYQAVMRQGVAFLPVVGVCSFFDMTYTYQKIDDGYLLRIKGENTVLTDTRFIDAAKSLFRSLLQDYLAQKEAPPVVENLPTHEEEVVEEEEEEEPIPETPLVLAVDMIDYNVNLPETLSNRGISAIFFFHLEQIQNQGALIRRLIGLGHSIGIQSLEETLPEIIAELEECNTLFYQQARSITLIVRVPSPFHQDIQSLGYLPWQGGEAQSLASYPTLITSLPQGDAVQYLTLEQTELTGQYWQSFYLMLEEYGFVLQIPQEDIL